MLYIFIYYNYLIAFVIINMDKNDNYNVWRKSTLQHFDLGAVISSLKILKTPPLPLTDSDSAGHVGCIDGRGRVFRSDITARGRSAAKCSSATHYRYHFIRLENRHVLFVSTILTRVTTHVNVFK